MPDFKVSDVKITPFQNSTGAVQAFATALINDSVYVSGFTVVKGGKNGLFLGWPSKKNTKPDKDGKDVLIEPSNAAASLILLRIFSSFSSEGEIYPIVNPPLGYVKTSKV